MTREQFIHQVESIQKPFRRFLTALCCGDSQLADDIAQESLVKAYMSSDGLADRTKFRAWVFKIGYNTFISSRRAVRPTVDYDAAAGMASADSADSSFRYQALYAALDRLPGKERTSILLYYMEGYSIKEVAEITDASADAVKQHLSRGRMHLRGILKTD